MSEVNNTTNTTPTPTTSTGPTDMKKPRKASGRRIAPLVSEESPSSVKSLYADVPSPAPPTASGTSSTATPSTTSTTDRIQRIMNDPDEWNKFREEMKKGGRVTNAAAALDQLMKRAREEEKEAKRKSKEEARKETENRQTDGPHANMNAGRDESGQQSNLDLVNKGLRWINQTLTAEASMNSQLSYQPSSDRSINRSRSLSNGAIFLEGTLGGGSDEGAASVTGAGGGGPVARRSRRGGRRRQPPNQEPDGSGAGVNPRQLPHRRNSADAVMNLGGYLTTNISAHADEDPMCLKTTKSRELADTKSLFERQAVFDEDLDAGANVSGHLNIPKDDDEGKSNLITETAKAVRRGSGSLVEYLSGIATIGDSRPATCNSDGLLEGWGGGRETTGASTRNDRIKQRGGRRGRSRSFDMLEAVQKGLGHEIDADDFVEGGGH
mmetsp:Transcript_26585/g.76788  ORF Transcript_26585/g.76788 Transcript_26585/m.76788 type:complete len:438 (-) Transcript_26585:64-1377(-)|eukprot:CAMPEP_0181045748 /NCGR_PEP_ID=MMETSP1070-20121207/13976_1 /TAXON_ID=265543 /ORGANISM="Minutocellus polymorphus, Strain NH13" /LENGTH=437 /DNA_ID=CAMNT_0023124303 /DNA_START=243 /DNA_END=1556 /DNA_ORIENTATION=-